MRSILYPYDHDVWDLLAKLATFPKIIPVLVARRIHWTTFRMFKDLGVLGVDTRSQYFSPSIDEEAFQAVTGPLSFRDCSRYEGQRPKSLVTFFSETGPRLGRERIDLWRAAAPIVEGYAELRDDDLDEGSRGELFRAFADDLNRAGIYRGGWAPVFEDDDSPGAGWDDYDI